MLQRYTSKSGSYFVLTQRFYELENASIFCHILRYLAQHHLEAIFAYVNPKKTFSPPSYIQIFHYLCSRTRMVVSGNAFGLPWLRLYTLHQYR